MSSVLPMVVVGIIPARAGFTYAEARDDVRVEDHPRSRGVYVGSMAVLAALYGSSPLARGLRFDVTEKDLRRGIIPARAGFTWLSIPTPDHSADHPRSRGVYTALT